MTSVSWHLDEEHITSAGRVRAGRGGEGPPLVLAHGWPWSSYAWHRVIPVLAERFRLHWYDMPGFGRSEMDPGQPSGIDVQGGVFAEMLAHWGLDRPLVVAHDFGGAVSLRAHLLHGRDYGRLVLMNVVAMRPWGSEFFEHVKRHVDAFTGLPPHIHGAVVDAYIRSAMAVPIPEEDVEALKAPWLSDDGRVAFYRQFAQADETFTAEIEDRYRALRCASAVLWGTEDPWIPLSRGEALAKAIGTPLDRLEGLGHLPQLEAPDRIVERVTAHLEAGA